MNYPKHSINSYRGINFEINYDQSPINPYTDWDGCTPLMYEGNSAVDYSDGDIVDYLRNYLSYNQVKRHQVRILEMMGESIEDFKSDHPIDEYDRTEVIKDDLLYDWLGDCIENKARFCEEFKIKYHHENSIGYSQGDCVDVFMCWTPKFGEVTGRDYKSMEAEDFESGLRLFSNWIWGDVYGFYIEEIEDSCWGFYGDDFEINGLMEMVKESIDVHLARQKVEREKRLKALIKNRVPVTKRKLILDGSNTIS